MLSSVGTRGNPLVAAISAMARVMRARSMAPSPNVRPAELPFVAAPHGPNWLAWLEAVAGSLSTTGLSAPDMGGVGGGRRCRSWARDWRPAVSKVRGDSDRAAGCTAALNGRVVRLRLEPRARRYPAVHRVCCELGAHERLAILLHSGVANFGAPLQRSPEQSPRRSRR